MRALLVIVLALLLAERAAELAIDRRNAAWLRSQGARWHTPDGFGLILASQTVLVAGLVVEGGFAAWAGVHAWTWPLLAIALGAQALRYWCITTLGRRWNVRVVTLPGARRVARGPYRFVSHPNYVAVLTESIVLPLAFGAWATTLTAGALTVVALARRIRIEERALRSDA